MNPACEGDALRPQQGRGPAPSVAEDDRRQHFFGRPILGAKHLAGQPDRFAEDVHPPEADVIRRSESLGTHRRGRVIGREDGGPTIRNVPSTIQEKATGRVLMTWLQVGRFPSERIRSRLRSPRAAPTPSMAGKNERGQTFRPYRGSGFAGGRVIEIGRDSW